MKQNMSDALIRHATKGDELLTAERRVDKALPSLPAKGASLAKLNKVFGG
jgi:hypothetical protein